VSLLHFYKILIVVLHI